ncbi:hypothetical protein MBLNU459_g3351t1 [Dothideomycetes sp. NU459]
MGQPEGTANEKLPIEAPSAIITPGDEALSTEAPAAGTTPKKSASFFVSFFALLIMVLIVTIDSTVLAVAIPIIARDLGGSTIQAFWANICFLLAVVVVQPVYMSTSDVIGRKIPLYTAFLLFFVGSIVFATAPNMGVVIAGRTIQGLGGSGLDVLNEVITADMTTLKERPLYLSLLAIPMAAGAILGPPVGALLAEYTTWRWIGWINLPLTGLGFVLVFFFLNLRSLEGSLLGKARRLDLFGMALFILGCATFVLPLSWAGSLYSWGSWQTLVPLIVGSLVLVILAIYERRPEQPVLPYRLFGSITAVTTLLGAFLHGLVLYAVNTYLPLFMQAVQLETPLQAAVTLLPFYILTLFFSVLSPLAVSKLGNYLWNIWIGWIFLALGLGLLSLINQYSSGPFRTGMPVVVAVGIGIVFTVLVLPMQASVQTTDDAGLAAGLLVCFRLFGGLVGLSLGATIFSSVFGKSVSALGTLPSNLAVLMDSNAAIGFIPQLRALHSESPGEKLTQVIAAYGDSFRMIWLVMVAFAGLGFVSSLFTKSLTIDNEELGRQRFEHPEEAVTA